MNYLKSVKEEKEGSLLGKKNVIGVGIGRKEIDGKETDRESIICYVVQKEDEEELDSSDIVSNSVGNEEVETDVKEIGMVWAESDYRKEKHRPSPCGVSIGHHSITAGTQGFIINTPEGKLIISNNHVLSATNKGKEGDSILQPGSIDGGTLDRNTIARLKDYERIVFEDIQIKSLTDLIGRIFDLGTKIKNFLCQKPNNLVDCAIAKPLEDSLVVRRQYDLFEPKGFTDDVDLGDKVTKSGRTTGITEGKIKDLDATIRVRYGKYGNKVAKFKDQMVLSDMSAGGDSGAAIIGKDSKLVCGLLYAGSEKATIANKIKNVIKALDLDSNL